MDYLISDIESLGSDYEGNSTKSFVSSVHNSAPDLAAVSLKDNECKPGQNSDTKQVVDQGQSDSDTVEDGN